MDSLAHLIYQTFFILMISRSADSGSDSDSEVESLLSFKRSITQDPYKRLSNWYSGSANPCNWTGIICSRGHEGHHVVEIHLGESSLHGTISEHIGNLSHLQILDLTRNQLSGTIPASLGRLPSLEYLRLSGNLLNGSIPAALTNGSKLSFLNLGGNSLQGTIPPTLLLNCRALEELHLHSNHLSGTIPPSLRNCPNLRCLNLRVNSLHGSIPSTLLNCTALEEVQLMTNYISGGIPGKIGRSLTKLHLAKNNLTGTVPASLCNGTSLEMVILSANKLTGSIPLCFGGLQRLEHLRARSNHLVSGSTSSDEPIPILQSLSNNSILKELVLDDNNLSGILPFQVGLFNLKLLSILSLASNAISGGIPQSLANLSSLKELDLSTNLLTGTIPPALGILSSMKILILGHNRLQGEIPSFLNTNLQYLHLSHNQLSGNICASFGMLQNFSYLNVSHNLLTGKIPLDLSNSQSLEQIDLSCNILSGNVTSQLISMNLKSLNLSSNKLSGVLPRYISVSMETLDLHSNKLSGSVPEWVYAVPHVNLSYNDFEGSIPCFSDKNVFLGNLNIRYNCSQEPVQTSAHSTKKIVRLASIVGSLSITVIIISFTVAVFYVKKYKDQSLDMILNQDPTFMFVGEQELMQATNSLDPSNFLGRGRYGDVYKGVLASGMTVAIKFFSTTAAEEDEGVHECFKKECRILGQIRHRNLVKIITASCNEKFRALILEFMPNGSLEDLLHRPRNDGRLMPLSLYSRIRLLKEVASALSYLHHDCNPPIIHCDLKPQNILLDEEMCAHISDFDLACILSRSDMTETSTSTLQGSIGYIAPEYGMGAELHTSGDVYSFGILILEVMTRIGPTDMILGNDFTLPKWIAMALQRGRTYCKEMIMENRDGQKQLEILDDEEVAVLEGMLKVGLWCTVEYHEQRPTMREVENLIGRLNSKDFTELLKSNIDAILQCMDHIPTTYAGLEASSSSS